MTERREIVKTLGDDPFRMMDLSIEEIFDFDQNEIDEFQLAGLQRRFAELRPALPPLDMLAEENHIEAINTIDEIVPLLFPHTEYKSYPLSLIDNCQFEHLNHWLNEFTTHDLTDLELDDCESIDDWLNAVEEHTPVRVVCSSGTSGKITLLPRSTDEERCIAKQFEFVYAKFGDEWGFGDPYGPDV